MIVAKNGDPDVKGGKCSLNQNPNQAFERHQWNSTGSPKGYSDSRIGYWSSANLEDLEVSDESSEKGLPLEETDGFAIMTVARQKKGKKIENEDSWIKTKANKDRASNQTLKGV